MRLADVDPDGAVSDAHEALWGRTRAEVLRAAALGGLAALAASPGIAFASGRSRSRDVAILQYALLLEHLQAAFYTEAERLKGLTAETATQARVVGAHERAHVKALSGVLGRAARKSPSFDFGEATQRPGAFRRTAVAFEDLSVAAYAGQVPNVDDRGYLAAALGILTVEARHASWIRRLAGDVPAARAFDEPRSAHGTRVLVGQTHFIRARPKTSGHRRPRYTG